MVYIGIKRGNLLYRDFCWRALFLEANKSPNLAPPTGHLDKQTAESVVSIILSCIFVKGGNNDNCREQSGNQTYTIGH